MDPKNSASDSVQRLAQGELAGEIDFLTARIRSQGSSRANSLLAPLDLKVRSYSVLSLACSDLAPTQREVAEFLSLDPSQIVPLVDQLESRGLVERVTAPHDRRTKVIAGTKEGKKLYLQARKATAEGEEASLEALSSEERTTLRELLTRIAFGA
ncbi:ranscriptional regulator [Glutamicibacter uratoxydans]|uniref:Ranscriptional regulator n=1 Tax=Glutamicibacter uratoxydans TaxID=43667 RepID=A0A4Y4DLS2_GLUUR|nr:MarR family transcriptional regulator [Glutamicibacter uratoxydans]GED06272.1 ranscriptional regulator [Glutamicibacter uratoxydans]